MTERDWLAATDPQKMLAFLRSSGKPSERKLLLFAVAVCTRVQHLLTRDYTQWCPKAINMWEQYADGFAADEELRVARSGAVADAVDAGHAVAHPGEADYYAVSYAAEAVAKTGEAETASQAAARAVAYDAVARLAGNMLSAIAASWEGRRWTTERWDADEATVAGTPAYLITYAAERAAQADLLRCIFGPLPFRRLTLAPPVRTWNDGCVMKLATAIYEVRRFEDLPVLADALEEAGCHDQEILGHLRGPGPHVRGCYILDLITGRE